MKTIIAPTDFSCISLNAVNYAADLACITGCDLVLLHVLPLPLMIGNIPVPAYGLDTKQDNTKEELDLLREDLLLKTRDRIKISCYVEVGDIVQKIGDYCKNLNPFLLVLGPETAKRLGLLEAETVTTNAIKEIKWPILIVPQDIHFSDIKRVGLACDLKKVVKTIPFNEIKAIVQQFKAELHVLHINTAHDEIYTAETVEQSAWLQEMLDDMHPVYHFLTNNEIGQALEDFAERNKLDLLIIVPKKHNMLYQIFHKSLTKQLATFSHVPLLAAHQ